MKTKQSKSEYAKAYYLANRESIRASTKQYKIDNVEKVKGISKSYRMVNKVKINQEKCIWRGNNPKKLFAHNRLNYAISVGLITRQPCSECGDNDTQGHHYDYDSPLDVIWLCPSHHRKLHEEHKAYTNG